MAMANASGKPTDGLSRVAKKVARPSGKLCAVIATALRRPTRRMLLRFFSLNAGSCLSRVSCGFGTRWSISTTSSTPPRNHKVP
ncbi:hypothetical protein D3C81_1774590 [compost metagenome]